MEQSVILNQEISIRYHADVVVLGGGLAGVAAAIAAARCGKRILLLEQSGCLGGLATNGHVSPFDATADRDGHPFGGIAQEILDRMTDAQIKYGVKDSGIKRAGPHLMKWVLLTMAIESHVDILFHATFLRPVMEGDRITYVLIATKSGIEAVAGDMFVDATGDGDLFARAGEEYCVGSEANSFSLLRRNGMDRMHFEKEEDIIADCLQNKGGVQPVSIMFTMGNVDFSKNPIQYNNKILTYEDLGIDREEFRKLPYFGTEGFEENGNLIPMPQGRILLTYIGRANEMLVNMSRIIGVDATDAVELTKAEVKAQMQVMYLVDFLKRYVPGFEDSYLVESGDTLGVRESRRLVGRYILNGDDAINCRHFVDDVACGSYMIDIHDPYGKRKAIGGDINGACYGIPYRSLTPKRVENLLVCGRCISVDHVAHASTRIQGTCTMTGQAAGTAAALALVDHTTVQKLDAGRITRQLQKDGIYLGK